MIEHISLKETQEAFDSCIRLPTLCETCPLREVEGIEKGYMRLKPNCRTILISNIRYWLTKAKENEE